MDRFGSRPGLLGIGLVLAGLGLGTRAMAQEEDRPAKVWQAHGGAVLQLSFSADGVLLASGGEDRKLAVWDVRAGAPRWIHVEEKGSVEALALAPDGRVLASGGDGGVKLWDLPAGKLRRVLAGPRVRAVAFSADGRRLAGGAQDGTVLLWDPEHDKEGRPLKGHTGAVRSVAFSLEGDLLVSGGEDRSLRLWDAHSGRPREVVSGRGSAVCCVGFEPMLQTVMAAMEGGEYEAWALQHDGSAPFPMLSGETFAKPVRAMAGVGVVAVALGGGERGGRGMLELHGLSWDPMRSVSWDHEVERAVTALAFAPDGDRLAAGLEDGSIEVWDLGPILKRAESAPEGGIMGGTGEETFGGGLSAVPSPEPTSSPPGPAPEVTPTP
jgi:WD40 domain-containing protein